MAVLSRQAIAAAFVTTSIVVAGAAARVAAQGLSPAAVVFELKATKAAAPPVVDGKVDDAVWQAAPTAGNFIQFEPRRGDPASARTEVRVLYDAARLYVAFRVWDAEPLTAQLTQRDANLFSDDAVGLSLDSFFDRRTGYFFVTNPLGTQWDGRIAEDGRQTDSTWDAPWRVAVQRLGDGWSAEFDIPFSSLKYAAGKDRTWGINFIQTRRRSLEVATWAGPLDATARVSQSGWLTGLDVEPQARRHQVIPYGLSRLQGDVAPDWQAGVDVRYAVTPQTSVYGTVNPDFATVEADQEQINLTRFEVSLPEKRQFFLEGQELFNQRMRTFYSRRIAGIEAGGKLLGKEGPWTMAVLNTESEPIGDAGRGNYTVARLQRDVSGRSNVAVMMANRWLAGVNQGSFSIDTNLFFTETLGMTAQIVKSYGHYGNSTEGFFFRPAYDSPTGHFHVRYSHLGERLGDNVNAIGQVKDDDRREVDSALEKTIWVRSGAFERVQYGSNYNVYWSQQNVLRSWQIDQSVEIEFRNRWSTEVSITEEFKRFEKDFRNRQVGIGVGYNTREYQSVKVGYEFGRNFDADYRLWTAEASYKITPQLSAEYSLERLELSPDPEHESTWIHVIRANQFFTKDLFLKVFYQTNSAIDRQNLQAVFVWRYLPPFGTIQLAYQRGTAPFGERSNQGNTLFLKATTVF
jgi:hypothetical protein